MRGEGARGMEGGSTVLQEGLGWAPSCYSFTLRPWAPEGGSQMGEGKEGRREGGELEHLTVGRLGKLNRLAKYTRWGRGWNGLPPLALQLSPRIFFTVPPLKHCPGHTYQPCTGPRPRPRRVGGSGG